MYRLKRKFIAKNARKFQRHAQRYFSYKSMNFFRHVNSNFFKCNNFSHFQINILRLQLKQIALACTQYSNMPFGRFQLFLEVYLNLSSQKSLLLYPLFFTLYKYKFSKSLILLPKKKKSLLHILQGKRKKIISPSPFTSSTKVSLSPFPTQRKKFKIFKSGFVVPRY